MTGPDAESLLALCEEAERSGFFEAAVSSIKAALSAGQVGHVRATVISGVAESVDPREYVTLPGVTTLRPADWYLVEPDGSIHQGTVNGWTRTDLSALQAHLLTAEFGGGAVLTDPSSPVVPSVGAVPVEVPEDAVEAVYRAFTSKPAIPTFTDKQEWTGVAEKVWTELAPLIAARVRAEERQRIDGLIAARLAAPVGMKEYGNDALVALRAEIAAGSAVPVATPLPVEVASLPLDELPDWTELAEAVGATLHNSEIGCSGEYETTMRWPDGRAAGNRDRLAIISADSELPSIAEQAATYRQVEAECAAERATRIPVATPTDPVDEVKCPGCGATIRARMSDRSTPERGAALEDLEHALTLALQAMAENDCCADEDDPDWRGPAIEQFRQDLRALGVRDAEMDAVGIKAPAEQDGQR